MATNFQLKNIFNSKFVEVLAANVGQVYPNFDEESFATSININLESLELKGRAQLIADEMANHLSGDAEKDLETLIEVMKIPINERDGLTKYPEFYYMPFGEFIGKYGLEYFELAMHANYELTKRFTAEFSIRPFIEKYPQKSLALLEEWVIDENHHVRRLVSEGTRPRLPWSFRLKMFQSNPQPVLELLERLKADPELYVRRSVANNLNDIAKDHPELVIQTLRRWKKDQNDQTDWIIKHAARSLIKAGHVDVLELLGFDTDATIELDCLQFTKRVLFGEGLHFNFYLKNTENYEVNAVIDFAIHFKKANGKLAPKVFKLAEKRFKQSESVAFTKWHPIKPISTRTYYAGIQKLEIIVNGKPVAMKDFELLMD